jgi:hypothetical protein
MQVYRRISLAKRRWLAMACRRHFPLAETKSPALVGAHRDMLNDRVGQNDIELVGFERQWLAFFQYHCSEAPAGPVLEGTLADVRERDLKWHSFGYSRDQWIPPPAS